jgi:head-tail adaptor
MRAGQFDRRITIEKPGTVDDPVYGPQPGGWTVFVARAPAEKKDDLPGNTETVENGLRLSGHPARIRMRYLRGITSDMRVIVHDEGDKLYEITSQPAELGRREGIEFTIKEFSS